MKVYFGLVGLFLALGLVYGEPPEEMKKFFDECEKEIGVSNLKGLTNFDDPKVKCFSACIFKKEGLLVDGKVDVEKAVELVGKHFPGKLSDSAKADITECANKANTGTDECEVGGAFLKCVRK